MRGRIAIAVVLAASALAPAGAPAAPPTPHQLSIAASSTRVVFGTPVVLTGQLTGEKSGGETVTLEEDPFPFGEFKNSVSTVTAADGTYRFERTPSLNVRYRGHAKSKSAATSPEVAVMVAPNVVLSVSDKTPKPGQKVSFSGTVAPAHDGAKAAIQRRMSSGAFKTVRNVVLADAGDAHSTFKRSLTINGGGVYRVVLASHDDHATGKSKRIRLTLDD
jgi:hypothetical protein